MSREGDWEVCAAETQFLPVGMFTEWQPGAEGRTDRGAATRWVTPGRSLCVCLLLALGGLSHPVTSLTFRLAERERETTPLPWPCHSSQEHLQELPWRRDPAALLFWAPGLLAPRLLLTASSGAQRVCQKRVIAAEVQDSWSQRRPDAGPSQGMEVTGISAIAQDLSSRDDLAGRVQQSPDRLPAYRGRCSCRPGVQSRGDCAPGVGSFLFFFLRAYAAHTQPWILKTAVRGKYCYPHFTGEETGEDRFK